MIHVGEVISYLQMCSEEGENLQRGMNYRTEGRSVVLMRQGRGAKYADRVIQDGRVLLYQGHNVPRSERLSHPERVGQQLTLPSGKPTENGRFSRAAKDFVEGRRSTPLPIRVYEKIREGIWTYNGRFDLIDAQPEQEDGRRVYVFRLEVSDDDLPAPAAEDLPDLEHNRIIPSSVKLEVWRRDGGKCVICGSTNNLHFDHNIPFSRGGSSLVEENVQLLCARHNLSKHAKIQ
jgi:hypothetical protein